MHVPTRPTCRFNFSSKVTITSVTPFNSSRGGKDMNVAGSVITSTAEVYGPKGEVVGIYQLLRHVVVRYAPWLPHGARSSYLAPAAGMA